jgi:hypothetical protein
MPLGPAHQAGPTDMVKVRSSTEHVVQSDVGGTLVCGWG